MPSELAESNNVKGISRTRKRFKTCGQSLWGCFKEYSEATSIHGIRYLGENKRPDFERIFWVIVFTISVCGCLKMIYTEWEKWDQTPVIVSFDDRETNVWKIPFPAITLCPETKFDPDFYLTKNFRRLLKIRNSTSFSDSDLFLERIKETSLIHVCDHDIIGFEENANQLYSNLSVPEILETIAPLTYFSCKWRNVPIDCEKLMTTSFTDEGICYTFNGLPYYDMYPPSKTPYLPIGQDEVNFTTQWNRQEGFSTLAGMETYPKRAIGSGKHRGLEISLSLFAKNEMSKCTDLRGFKGLIHAPDNIPQLRKRFFYIAFKRRVTVTVKPNMIFTVPSLRSYSFKKRQCIFDDEVKLVYFKVYTRINCETECLLNFTIKQCNCRKYYMPDVPGVRICQTITDYVCCENAANILLENEFKYASKTGTPFENEICRCFPPCTSIEYNTEISQSKFKGPKRLLKQFERDHISSKDHYLANAKQQVKYEGLNITDEPNADNDEQFKEFVENEFTTSVLTIMFKEDSFISSRRSELYGLSSFLSNCGGLLGLFMGVSALSFIEIFYFSIIRAFSNNCKSGYTETQQNDH